MNAFYEEDLAYVHHVGFAEAAHAAAPFLLECLSDAGIAAGRVVDLGCGSGHWLRLLGEAGYAAEGIEVSPAFVALARREAPAAKLRGGSLWEAPLPACAAVTALGEVLNYIGPGSEAGTATAPPLDALFARVATALPAGGLFVFDAIVRDHAPGESPLSGRNWRAGADWAVMTAVEEHEVFPLLTRDIMVFRAVGETWRRSEERHRQYLFAVEDLRGRLAAAGFAVESAPHYGDCALPPRRRAFLARKL